MNFSCVYSFQCKDKSITDLYIGSTKNYMLRKIAHKYDCCNINSKEYNRKVYKFIREKGGWDNWEMIVEVKTDDLNKEQLLELEQIYLCLLKPELNCYNSIGKDKNRRKKYIKIKENCPECGKEMLKICIKKHLRESCK